MIRCNNITVPAATISSLQSLQASIDAEPTFQSCVRRAKKDFKEQNKPRNPIFKLVRTAMKAASDAGHCAYCEVDTAAEIDHFKPATLYPGTSFDLDNYVPCCAICNKRKGERFPTFNSPTGAAVTLHKVGRSNRVAPPDLISSW